MAEAMVQVERDGAVARVWINRPELRNAFNPEVIAGLRDAFEELSTDQEVRAVVLGGRGDVFCAGADLSWMKEMAGYTRKQNLEDALALANMLATINSCAKPVVCRLQKAAFGGALGLAACCDVVVSTSDALFAFSEVRLGISPATIAPFVIAKTGVSFARSVMLSGKRFDAPAALAAGLVHRLVDPAELDEAVDDEVAQLMQAGPEAASATKQLLQKLADPAPVEVVQATAQLIADLRASAEGQEGLGAFLEKRKPDWTN